ncbi:MAG: hypothetical protein ACJ8F1_09460 [Polyangia bacterium]
MKRRFVVWGGVALLSVAWFGATGCETTTCTGDVAPPQATFRLHLPPVADATGAEIVRACKSSGCTTATLPAAAQGATQVTFTDFLVIGQLSLGAGGVRVLNLFWTVDHVDASSPHDDYTITVTDSAGQVTGTLTAEVQYSRAAGLCGTETWTAPLTTD